MPAKKKKTKYVTILGGYSLAGISNSLEGAKDNANATGDVEDCIIYEVAAEWVPSSPRTVTWKRKEA